MSTTWTTFITLTCLLTSSSSYNAGSDSADTPFYVIKDRDSYCLLARFNLSVDIHYPKQDGTTGHEAFELKAINISSDSRCGAHETKLSLAARPNGSAEDWRIWFTFVKTLFDIQLYYSIGTISFTYVAEPSLLPDIAVHGLQHLNSSDSLFKAPLGTCYKCETERSVSLQQQSGGKSTAILRISSAKIEAFTNSSTGAFSDKVTTCSADATEDNIVPIAVGITLAVLIVTALVVFIIFSRRNRRFYDAT
ncbi:unnamed protein product [Dicrocoelium dendriticum]|nr:unnamed protein product [Dicrocoelium dendriticum]